MLTADEVLRRFESLRRAPKAGGGRAPHKPLLALYLLGCVQQEQRRHQGVTTAAPLVVPYASAEPIVSALIAEFGPPARRGHRAALPFFHLDRSIWMPEGDGLAPTHAVLRDRRAIGRFVPEVESALRADPALLVEVARRLLTANFPPSYVAPICEAVGLDIERADERPAPKKTRDSDFRPRVLLAYAHACAFCGFDGMLCGMSTQLAPVAIAAAHVRWHALEGPDEVSNGLALCDLHHTLFDRGLLGLDESRSIVVSPSFSGRSDAAQRFVRELEGRPLREPSSARERVEERHLRWHREQVFRGSLAA